MQTKIIALAAFVLLGIWACKPEQADEYNLGGAATAPSMEVELLPGPENRVVIRDLSSDASSRVWDLPGANPKSSVKTTDTVQYALKGTYTITLHVVKGDGSGTAIAQKTVNIVQDAPLSCSPKLALLTGDCGPAGKCWTWSQAAGAIKVGPTYDDFSWFASTQAGLQAAQYDDAFCFSFDGTVYENRNNGATVNPWNGYAAEPIQIPKTTFTFLNGSGTLGRDQLLLEGESQFMGVRDCDNLLDIVKLTETELVVRARICNASGVPAAEGWFELTFVRQ